VGLCRGDVDSASGGQQGHSSSVTQRPTTGGCRSPRSGLGPPLVKIVRPDRPKPRKGGFVFIRDFFAIIYSSVYCCKLRGQRATLKPKFYNAFEGNSQVPSSGGHSLSSDTQTDLSQPVVSVLSVDIIRHTDRSKPACGQCLVGQTPTKQSSQCLGTWHKNVQVLATASHHHRHRPISANM
jgi:hypothetical protein